MSCRNHHMKLSFSSINPGFIGLEPQLKQWALTSQCVQFKTSVTGVQNLGKGDQP